ncbi:50S ribosomal protein L34e [Candidatus Woesearchaeota archaeon]|nr:50S ribosomal protein L34e [Candidatus Woesearchaeota archaeon]
MKIRKLYSKLPGNKLKVIEKRAIPKIAGCGICGKRLQGIPKLSNSKFRGLAKSKKRPNRPYGGSLCSKCMRNEIIRKVRS